MRASVMKLGSTLFLKAVIFLIGIAALAMCTIALPAGVRTTNVGGYKPILLGMYIPAIPFFFALYQALRLLSLIDNNKAFSDSAAQSLKLIKYCALLISALYAAGMPYIYYVADKDDAPGVVLIGFIIIGASFVIATTTAMFQSLIQNAVDIKSENDLTI